MIRAALLGGRFDGDIETLGDIAPPKLTRLVTNEEEIPPGQKAVPTVEYLRTERTRADGCVVYVLKGAAL